MSEMIDGFEDEVEEELTCTECEICGDSCTFIPFPCRDDNGQLAEIQCCCQKCHDTWCLCDCKKTIEKEGISK